MTGLMHESNYNSILIFEVHYGVGHFPVCGVLCDPAALARARVGASDIDNITKSKNLFIRK